MTEETLETSVVPSGPLTSAPEDERRAARPSRGVPRLSAEEPAFDVGCPQCAASSPGVDAVRPSTMPPSR